MFFYLSKVFLYTNVVRTQKFTQLINRNRFKRQPPLIKLSVNTRSLAIAESETAQLCIILKSLFYAKAIQCR